ncbi:hypothetical protein PAAM106076_18220 [Paracoccus aminovorans]
MIERDHPALSVGVDLAQALGGNLQAIAVEDLFQLAPCVRPAMRQPNGIR